MKQFLIHGLKPEQAQRVLHELEERAMLFGVAFRGVEAYGGSMRFEYNENGANMLKGALDVIATQEEWRLS